MSITAVECRTPDCPLLQQENAEMEDIVRLLSENPSLVSDVISKQGRFIPELDLTHAEFITKINNCVNEIKTPRELVKDVLQTWIRHKGSEATINILYKALSSIGNVALADDLEKKYDLEAKVVDTYNHNSAMASEDDLKSNTVKSYDHNRTYNNNVPILKIKLPNSSLQTAVYAFTLIFVTAAALLYLGRNHIFPQATTGKAVNQLAFQQPNYDRTDEHSPKEHNPNTVAPKIKNFQQPTTTELIPMTTSPWLEFNTKSISTAENFNNTTTPKYCKGKARKVKMKDIGKIETRHLLMDRCVTEWEELRFHKESPRLLKFILQYATSLRILFVGLEICEGLGNFRGASLLEKDPVRSKLEKFILDPVMPAECSDKILMFIAKHFKLDQLHYVIFPEEFLIQEWNLEGLNNFLDKFGSNLKALTIHGGFNVFNESSVPFKIVNFVSLETLIFNNTAAYSTFDVDTARNLLKGSSGSPLQRLIMNLPLQYRSSYLISHYHKTLSEVELIIDLEKTSIFDFLELFRDSSNLKHVNLELIDRFDGSCSGKTIYLVNFGKNSIPDSCQTISIRSLCPLNLGTNSLGFEFTRYGKYFEYNFVKNI